VRGQVHLDSSKHGRRPRKKTKGDNDGAHLRSEGLDQIIKIKSGMNQVTIGLTGTALESKGLYRSGAVVKKYKR
jgi:hypothetical protein